MIRLRTIIHSRLEQHGEDPRGERGAALISTLLFMVILSGLSIVILGILLGQIAPSYLAEKGTRTIYAAQAGLQAGLGLVRSAQAAPDATGLVFGDLRKLPCMVTGSLAGNGDDTGYTVSVQYFVDDPTGKPATWVASNSLACATGSGVSEQPNFALITSEGRAAAIPGREDTVGNRYLSATYQFKVSNENVPGGRIFAAGLGSCFDVERAEVGRQIRYLPAASCVEARDDFQLWVYGANYQITLASTTLEGRTPLCITDSNTGANAPARLQECRTDAGRWSQLWSWVGGEAWKGQKVDIAAGPSSRCLAPGASSRLVVNASTCSGSFAPEPAVGAGAAGYGTRQMVNYKEFGRCADVTNEQITYSFMITYPCKQDPTGTGNNLLWNHKWYYQEPAAGVPTAPNQEISVNYLDRVAEKYCLQAPTTASRSIDVVFKPCINSAQQKWTRQYDTGDYRTSYLFVDFAGRCLEADNSVPFTGSNVNLNGVASRVVVKTCNGVESQKWNAPPSYSDANFGGFKELGG